MFGFDPEAQAAAAARNAQEVPEPALKGTPLGYCQDCKKRFEYRGDTDINNLDPCPNCDSMDWRKWGYRFNGEDLSQEEVRLNAE